MKMKNYFSFVSLLILFSCSQSADKDSLRSLSAGLVIGFEGENNTFVWKGIPFASPPIDSLRWKAPLDPEPLGRNFGGNEISIFLCSKR